MPTVVTTSVQIPVELALQNAIGQAESLKKIVKESVRPDSSAYREIENMLNKVTRQAEGFKQVMNESLKTSSGSKTFTNNLQKTFDLLSNAANRLNNLKSKDLIFSESDVQLITNLRTQISGINQQIKQLQTNKIGSFFSDSSIPEFKQLQDLAKNLNLTLSKITFEDFQNAVSTELDKTNKEIERTTEKIQTLDSVLKNVNLTDINKLTKGLQSQSVGNTVEVFKADNLTEAMQRLQAFYQHYSDYTGKMRSKIKEGGSISQVLETENKEINSHLSGQIASLTNYQSELEQALATLKNISGHKAGQSRESKREILNSQSMQDLFKSIGFKDVLDKTGDPSGFIMKAREAITKALEKVTVDITAFTNLRISMLEGLKSVFDGLETNKVIGDSSKFQTAISNWLTGNGINVKDSGIVQALNEIKKNANIEQVLNSITAAVGRYVQQTQQAKTATEQEAQSHAQYAASLEQNRDAIGQYADVNAEKVTKLQEEIAILNQRIEELESKTQQQHQGKIAGVDGLSEASQKYQTLINQLNSYTSGLAKTEEHIRTLGNIRTAITNWMGFNQVLNLVKRAATDAMNHIKQLDTTMNGIAIVTNMTTEDLWKQVSAYSEMAQKFGVTIQGAYEVSKIYYQAGYETNEVLTLTNETLKLSKISGLDYATTTNYMMTAMRGFKLEMEDASRVVDVYSNLAANTAVSQQELAEAMTKTASSMESVGATFEETSAMIATMVAVTRESANNIGSALKSIASRYGELTKDPSTLIDADGEAMSFNKVDAALKSVGISMQTADHQFRDFTEVIIELAEKWDTLDSVAQRYIATQFAGNRQQSRFLALVSNVDLLKENIENAQNSEDVGTLQALEALDSLESKLNQVQVAYQQFYTTIGIENVWKSFLDGAKNVINTLNSLPKLFDTIPLGAIGMVTSVVDLIKTLALQGFAGIVASVVNQLDAAKLTITQKAAEAGTDASTTFKISFDKGLQGLGSNIGDKLKANAGQIVSSLGSIGVLIGGLVDKSTEFGRSISSWSTGIGGFVQAAGGILQGALTHNWAGVIMTVATGVLNIINGVSLGIETTAEKLDRLTKEAENLNNEAKKTKAEYNTLQRAVDKLEELKVKRYESAEAEEEYKNAMNELADMYPQLIQQLDNTGNAIVETGDAEKLLADLRRESAKATMDAVEAERNRLNTDIENAAEEGYGHLDKTVTGITENAVMDQSNLYTVIRSLDGKYYKVSDALMKEISNAMNNYIFETEEQQEEALRNIFNEQSTIGVPKIYTLTAEDKNNQLYEEYEAGNLYERLKALRIENKAEDLKNLEVQEAIIALNNDIKKYLDIKNDKTLEALYEEGSDWLQLIEQVEEIQTKQNLLPTVDKNVINSHLAYYNDNLRDNNLLRGIVTNSLYNDSSADLDNLTVYMTAGNSIVEWYNNLFKQSQQLFEDMLNDTESYSAKDIISMDEFKDMDSDETIQMIQDYYADRIQSIRTRLVNQFEQVWNGKSSDFTKAYTDKLPTVDTEDEAQLLSSILNQWQHYTDLGLTDKAELIGNELLTFYSEIQKLEPTLRNTALDIINQYGFNTISSIEQIIKALGQVDIDINTGSLETVKDNMITNLSAELQVALDSIVTDWPNKLKKITSALTDGLSIADLDSFLNELANLNVDIDLTKDITWKDGKATLSAKIVEDYVNAVNTTYDKINEETEQAIAIVKTISKFTLDKNGNLPELSILALKSLGINYENFVQKIIKDEETIYKLDEEGLRAAIDDAIKTNQEALERYGLYNAQVIEQYNQVLFNSGDYSKVYGGNLFDLIDLAKGKLKPTSQLEKQAKETLNSAYDQLINDALSKGLDQINLDDYTGLIPAFKDITSRHLSGSLTAFIEKYSSWAGKTIEEHNALMLQAIEKDTKAVTSGVNVSGATSALKNLTIFGSQGFGSLSDIQSLADALGISIGTIVQGYIKEIDVYKFDLSTVPAEKLAELQNKESIIADSINEFLDTIIKSIGTGVQGKLSYEGRDTLIGQLHQIGISDVSAADFKETAEGLKLSDEAAQRLYFNISKISAYKGQLTFDEIYDSLTKAGSGLENISKTTAEIIKLQRELANAEGDTSGLEQRLSLLKQIQATQANNADSYSFMDRKLPEYLQGPQNYWNSVGKAYTAMNEAASSGYMEIDDFYNIVNEMANLVQISGGEVELMGMKFDNAAEMSASLIEKGLSALSNVDGKGVKISMAKLGADFGIGVEDMSKGFDDGVKEMARSQIKMLDAQIALLEAVVAMEGLGDLNVDNVEGFSFGDVFNIDENGKYLGGFTEQYSKWAKSVLDAAEKNQELQKSLQSISFNDKTLYQMLKDGVEGANLSEKEAEQYFAAIQSLYLMLQSGEYDLENLLPSIQKIAAASHFEGEIKVGDSKLLFTHGFVLEQNEKGKYTYDGKEFSSIQDAQNYMALVELGAETKAIKENKNKAGETISYTSEIELGQSKVIVTSSEGGLQYFTAEGNGPYSSIDALIQGEISKYRAEHPEETGTDEEIAQIRGFTLKTTIEPQVEVANPESLENATHEKITELAQALATGSDKEVIEAAKEVGIEVTANVEGNLTETQRKEIAELAGIDSKTVSLNIVTNSTDPLVTLLGTESASKDITLNISDASNLQLAADAFTQIQTAAEALTKINWNGIGKGINSPGQGNASGTGLIADLNKAKDLLDELKTAIEALGEIEFINFSETLPEEINAISESISSLTDMLIALTEPVYEVKLNTTNTGNTTTTNTTNVTTTVDISMVVEAAEQLGQLCAGLATDFGNSAKVVDEFATAAKNTSDASSSLSTLNSKLAALGNLSSSIASAASSLGTLAGAINNIKSSLNNIPSGTKQLDVQFRYTTAKANAKGNVALAKGDQDAMASGTPTLMGELGPELVVSHGRYFIVGQMGAEFVNLDKDAIVFNHKQTKQLLGYGSIGSRGTPFTNETNAISFAKGNYKTFGPAMGKPQQAYIADDGTKQSVPVSTNTSKTNTNKNIAKTTTEKISSVSVSPPSGRITLLSRAKGSLLGGLAMASAAQALAALKQIRAMWQSMLDASAKDLGSMAGKGGGGKKGGGGGGKGGGNEKEEDPWQQKTTTAEIQRWYNLLRQIADLEKQITYQETLQSKLENDRVKNGTAIYNSQKTELNLLRREINASQELAALQKSWYDEKRAELATSSYGLIFTYDENGLQQYTGTGEPGSGLGLDILENLTRRDIYGQAMDNAATAQQQLNYLRSVGFDTDKLRYNSDGTTIVLGELTGEELDNAYVQMMENFWDEVDGWRDELDGIYDSYHEQLESILSNEDKRNQILQKMVDNQIEVENLVEKAIESREQLAIDQAQKERDALSESADKMINGLSNTLAKEREMYQRDAAATDLNKLRRQLTILERSGGASNEIRSLQQQIESQSQEMYFQSQEDQINALKQASDAQIKKMDEQISLMTETLEYQKNNGLLWKEVYDVLNTTPEKIQEFIITNTPDFQSKSALQVEEDISTIRSRIDQWIALLEDTKNGNDPMAATLGWSSSFNAVSGMYNEVSANDYDQASVIYASVLQATGDPNKASEAALASLEGYKKVGTYRDATPNSNLVKWGSGSNSGSSGGYYDGGYSGGGYSGGGYSSDYGGYEDSSYSSSSNTSSSSSFPTIGSGYDTKSSEYIRLIQQTLANMGYNPGPIDGIWGNQTKQAIRAFQRDQGLSVDGVVGPLTWHAMGYKKGGLVNYTGIAMVHGSASHPEGFLSAEQTADMRDMFMSKDSILPSLLQDYKYARQTFGSLLNKSEEGGGMSIGNVEVNLNIASIANDYDAQRAAEQVAEHLLKIARKSGSLAINRR